MSDNLHISLTYNDNKTVEIPVGKMTFFDEFYVDCQTETIEKSEHGVTGTRLRMMLHPKEDVTLQDIDIQLDKTYLSAGRVFCNGYQSWSESREFSPRERIPHLRRIARPLKYWMGDEFFTQIRRESGWLHSWTYTYVRTGKDFFFAGSFGESTFSTLSSSILSFTLFS